MRVCGRKLLHKNYKFIPLQASTHAVLVNFVERFHGRFAPTADIYSNLKESLRLDSHLQMKGTACSV